MCVLGLNKMNIWRIKGESWVGVFKSKLLPESLTVMVLHFSHKMPCSTSLVSDTAPVSQSTSEDRCWCLMGFYSVNGNCEAKTTTKKNIMKICVWELRQPSTCFFFFISRGPGPGFSTDILSTYLKLYLHFIPFCCSWNCVMAFIFISS